MNMILNIFFFVTQMMNYQIISQSLPFSLFTVHAGLDVVVVQGHDHLVLVELERVGEGWERPSGEHNLRLVISTFTLDLF